MRIGFAGLGRMGALMARNLVRSGFNVTVWNRTGTVAVAFAKANGCRSAHTPAELAENADVLVTMLADDVASQAVHSGPDGLFAGNRPAPILEMGTMSPSHIADLRACAPMHTKIIDAPVSGATQAADAASLMIMLGCDEDFAQPLLPILEEMGEKVICLGSPGAGAVMKLAVNSMIHNINQSLAEAMTLAEAAGIDPKAAFDTIEASAACAPMLKYRRPLYLDGAAQDVTFTVALARKDMEIVADLACKLGVATPQSAVTLEQLRRAGKQGFDARDMASILAFMRKGNT